MRKIYFNFFLGVFVSSCLGCATASSTTSQLYRQTRDTQTSLASERSRNYQLATQNDALRSRLSLLQNRISYLESQPPDSEVLKEIENTKKEIASIKRKIVIVNSPL
jgi:peptidoglycan hydrolase CwlO-like protein